MADQVIFTSISALAFWFCLACLFSKGSLLLYKLLSPSRNDVAGVYTNIQLENTFAVLVWQFMPAWLV